MKITQLEVHRVEVSKRGGWLFVQVHTDEGLVGLGEASQGGDDALVAELIEQRLSPALAGSDPLAIGPFFQRFASLGASRPGATALSGVEQALWDIAGQAAGRSIAQLLGGVLRPRIWIYANINRSTWDRSPEGFAANARRAVADGFRAVKLAAFDDVPRRLDSPEAFATIQLGIDRVLAVREAVGRDVEVLLDCHSHFTAAWAIRVARELEPARLFWIEDPVPRTDLEGLARVHAAIEQPLATGETLFGRRPFWELLARQACDVVMPDVKHCGGIGELMRIGALCEPAHVQVAPHNPSGPVALVASSHVGAVLPNFMILEYAYGEAGWRPSLVTPPERFVDGFYEVPVAPGLGVRLNEAALEAHAAHRA